MKIKLFTVTNQRSTFLCAVKKTMASSALNNAVIQTCTAGHANFDLIVITAFYCFAKNELKRLNAPKRDEPPKMNRKIRNLQSCSTSNT